MELKVWLDGLPRIVCGVNDKTTCQDIVFALAQATGKTGRFTLIERWRNNDRLLAPSEVVMKWGEHSPDVQYILQCTSIDAKTAKTPPSPSTSNTDPQSLKTATTSSQEETPSAPPPYRNPPTPVKGPAKSPGKELPPYRLPPPPSSTQSNNLRTQQQSTAEESPVTDKPPHDYKDLIHHINRQREKLTAQQAELTKHDAEIMFWETKARIQERNMETISKEITRLEILALQNDAQVQALKDVEEESETVMAESNRLRQETVSLRNDLARCDQELSHCKNTIRMLGESLASTEAEILRQALTSACEETEAICATAGNLESEVSSLAISLGKKKAQMEELVSAMKKANLESLGMGEEESLFRSRRRIRGSARQLKDAAPTTTNPHGVWV